MSISLNSDNLGLTFSEVAQLHYKSLGDSKVSSQKRYKSTLDNWLLPVLGSLPIKELTANHQKMVKEHYMGTFTNSMKRHTPGGLRTVLKYLKSILNYGIAEGFLLELPFKVAEPCFEQRSVPLMEVFDVPRYLDAVDGVTNSSNLRFAIRLLLFLGLQPRELRAIRWAWFKADFSSLTLNLEMGWEAQVLPIPQVLRNDLAHLKYEAEKLSSMSGKSMPVYVFAGEKGQAKFSVNLNAKIQAAATRCGLEGKWTAHTLRCNCASIHYQLGVPMHDMMLLLGIRPHDWRWFSCYWSHRTRYPNHRLWDNIIEEYRGNH